DGYVAIQAYLAPDEAIRAELDRLAGAIAEGTGAAVTIGFGPRFLHSTGQYHKGGTPSGVFLQVVDHPRADLAVPETDYTFAGLIAAQSFGDQAALSDRDRPVAMVVLGDAGPADLPRLTATIERALQ
ncbi:MAG: glucose-6-phosphate isomerase, partial [Actinobacteria bacterium]|nr:glucose-6-phosphate isomerase [Actinomycetota bacterium]